MYYTTAPGVIGNVLYQSSTDGHFHYDALGNVVFTTLSDSTPGYLFDQEAYGNVKVGGSQSGYHLTTKEYDAIPEIYYFWQRWYDPVLGRFLSKAPLPPHIEHPYVFVSSKPTKYADPKGKWEIYLDPFPGPPANPEFLEDVVTAAEDLVNCYSSLDQETKDYCAACTLCLFVMGIAEPASLICIPSCFECLRLGAEEIIGK